jgi:hypothetical protein
VLGYTLEAGLWRGDVEAAAKQFDDWPHERADRFIAYLAKHRHRIVNYAYYQTEGISIGSGEIESTVKQIGRRMKISGALTCSTISNSSTNPATLPK